MNSEIETRKHIKRVSDLLLTFIQQLITRSKFHDATKLESPEKEAFEFYTPILSQFSYQSPEYKSVLGQLKATLNHHYLYNSHHPEHYTNGIAGMTLLDLVEMFCDWKAASERHADGDLYDSIKKNKSRFLMSDQLVSIFENTAKLFDGE